MERRAARTGSPERSDRGDVNREIISDRLAGQEAYASELARQNLLELENGKTSTPELSLETERALARRFGEEWRRQPRDVAESVAARPREIDGGEWTKSPETRGAEAAMQRDLARLEATGTTDANHGLITLLRRGAAAFRELLADERGALARELPAPSVPEADQAEPQTWVARVLGEVKERGARLASRWFRTGPDEPDIFQQDLAAHIAAGPKTGGDFPLAGDDGGGGGGGGDGRLLRSVEPEEPDQRPQQAAQPAAPVAAEMDAPENPSVEDDLAAEFMPMGEAYQRLLDTGPDWMNDIIEEELPGAADEPSADPPEPEPEPEPDNGPDMG
jgi:hypothetical protein